MENTTDPIANSKRTRFQHEKTCRKKPSPVYHLVVSHFKFGVYFLETNFSEKAKNSALVIKNSSNLLRDLRQSKKTDVGA